MAHPGGGKHGHFEGDLEVMLEAIWAPMRVGSGPRCGRLKRLDLEPLGGILSIFVAF